MTRTAEPTDLRASSAFHELQAAVRDSSPLLPLDPAEYAAGHALFEARSDQRAHLTAWLVGLLGHRSLNPTRVLSIGCGDGSVDVRVAEALAAGGRRVDYTGIEPHPPSARACADRLASVAGVDASVLRCTLTDADLGDAYDIVLAVHSLYYVDDLGAALRRARALLAPGGVLVVLHAPFGRLNRLVRLLAPGRRQEFSEEVSATLTRMGSRPEVTRLDSRLDLSETGDADTDRRLLDFTVQARLSPSLQRAVRAALVEQSLPGPGTVVEHPVDAVVLPAAPVPDV